jgi:hypothetical protein
MTFDIYDYNLPPETKVSTKLLATCSFERSLWWKDQMNLIITRIGLKVLRIGGI